MIYKFFCLAVVLIPARIESSGPARRSPQRRSPASDGQCDFSAVEYYPRGLELLAIISELGDVISSLVAPFQENPLTLYEEQVFPQLRRRIQTRVTRLAQLCAGVATIVAEDKDEGSGDRARCLVSLLKWFLDFGAMKKLESLADNIRYDFISYTRGMAIPILLMQALIIIQNYLFMSPHTSRDRGGWQLDFARYGVDVSTILPGFILRDPASRISRLEYTHLLDRRLGAFRAQVEFPWDLHPGASDISLRRWLMEELDKINSRVFPRLPQDLMVEEALQQVVFPKVKLLLAYLWSIPDAFARSRAKLIADVFEFTKPALNVSDRITLFHEFGFAHSVEDHTSPIYDAKVVPHAVFWFDEVDQVRLVNHSRTMLRNVIARNPFAYAGISIRYESESAGDGVRRDWVSRMVEALFIIYEGEEEVDDLVAYWEYSDDTRRTIRPREIKQIRSESHRNQLQSGLILCGQILGISIAYNIVPGVALSPASLALLQQPNGAFWALAREEDPQFCDNAEKLRSLNWDDAESVSASLPDETVATDGGERVMINRENLEHYILQRKYQRLIGSIYHEMALVAHGISGFLRKGSLDLMTRDELSGMLAGTQVLNAAAIVSGMDWSACPSKIKEWLSALLGEMTKQQLNLFLIFVTGSAHIPPFQRGFWIRTEVSGDPLSVVRPESTYPLPSSRTCFRVLHLPRYPSKESLKRKLVQAITEGRSLVNE